MGSITQNRAAYAARRAPIAICIQRRTRRTGLATGKYTKSLRSGGAEAGQGQAVGGVLVRETGEEQHPEDAHDDGSVLRRVADIDRRATEPTSTSSSTPSIITASVTATHFPPFALRNDEHEVALAGGSMTCDFLVGAALSRVRSFLSL